MSDRISLASTHARLHTACKKCRGLGVRKISPSKKTMHRHKLERDKFLATPGEKTPPPSPICTVPCKACNGIGLDQLPGIPTSSKLEIAVIGGGIGGCALALALQQRGFRVRVYERDSHFNARAQGYGLTMQQGARTLRQLGFSIEHLAAIGVSATMHHSYLPDQTLLGAYGRSVNEKTKAIGGNGRGQDQRFNLHIPRQTLRRLLYEALAPGTVIWAHAFLRYNLAEPATRNLLRNDVGNGQSRQNSSEGNADLGEKESEPTWARHRLQVHLTAATATAAEEPAASATTVGGGPWPMNASGDAASSLARGALTLEGKRLVVDVADVLVGGDGIWSAVRRQKLTGAGNGGKKTPRPLPLDDGGAVAGDDGAACNDAPHYLGVMVVLGRSSVPGHPLTDCSPDR